MKRPSLQFYPGDWRRDAGLQTCSLAARGLWIEMMVLMHDGEPYGYLRVGKKDIHQGLLAQMVGAPEKEVQACLRELEDANVFSRDDAGTIFSRRMVRDEELRQTRAAAGHKSLDNPNVPRPKHKEGCPARIPNKDVPIDNQQGSAIGSRCRSSMHIENNYNTTADKNCQPDTNCQDTDELIEQIISAHPKQQHSQAVENEIIEAAGEERQRLKLNTDHAALLWLLARTKRYAECFQGRECYATKLYDWLHNREYRQSDKAWQQAGSAEAEPKPTHQPESRIAHLLERKRRMEAGEELD